MRIDIEIPPHLLPGEPAGAGGPGEAAQRETVGAGPAGPATDAARILARIQQLRITSGNCRALFKVQVLEVEERNPLPMTGLEWGPVLETGAKRK